MQRAGCSCRARAAPSRDSPRPRRPAAPLLPPSGLRNRRMRSFRATLSSSGAASSPTSLTFRELPAACGQLLRAAAAAPEGAASPPCRGRGGSRRGAGCSAGGTTQATGARSPAPEAQQCSPAPPPVLSAPAPSIATHAEQGALPHLPRRLVNQGVQVAATLQGAARRRWSGGRRRLCAATEAAAACRSVPTWLALLLSSRLPNLPPPASLLLLLSWLCLPAPPLFRWGWSATCSL